MRVECTASNQQIRTSGIGTDMLIGDDRWAFYPVDLSCEDKYIGYIVNPERVSYHVLRSLYLDKVLHLWLRKIRTDRGIKRPSK